MPRGIERSGFRDPRTARTEARADLRVRELSRSVEALQSAPIASGTLVAPFARLRMPTGAAYYLIENPARRERPAVVAFRDWVLAEFRRGPQRLT